MAWTCTGGLVETRPMAADMPGIGLEFGGKIFDPMGFATFSDESLIWFRACELKHSRVAMLACAGWIVNGLHLSLPGTIDYETKFSDLAALPPSRPSRRCPTAASSRSWAGSSASSARPRCRSRTT